MSQTHRAMMTKVVIDLLGMPCNMKDWLLVLEHFVLTCMADTLRANTLRQYMENVTSALEMIDEIARKDGMREAGAGAGAGSEVDPTASVRTAIHCPICR